VTEAPVALPAEETEDLAQAAISQWEFIDRIPTEEEVVALLKTLPPVYGIEHADYADYVQGLPGKKKIKVPHPENPNLKIDQYVETVTLYMGVAGRLKMLQAAAEKNGWRVDFEPEPVTPTGMPGMLQMDERIVYREYVVISTVSVRGSASGLGEVSPELVGKPIAEQVLGRKPGTAWVPKSGGSQAAGSNPYEKVETSARGRAIAAWGFGVLPGSGIASLEEMLGARQNERGMLVEQHSAPKASREDLIAQAMTLQEEMRQEVGDDEATMVEKTGKYLQERLGVRGCYDPDTQSIDWSKVKDGQVLLLVNSLKDSLKRVRANAADA
jgi:hypothetical protein